MNYHIMVQDKFLDSYIEDIFEINEQSNNVFWFRGTKGENGLVKTTRPVQYLGNNITYWREKFSEIEASDSIFVHWYDFTISKILYDLPNPIYVMLWGGEFYNEPFWYHQWVYDRKTLRFLKQTLSYPNLSFTFNLLRLYRDLKTIYFFKKALRNEYYLKNRLIGRIDYLIFLETNDKYFQDYHKIKELYPLFKAENICGFYDQNFDIAQSTFTKKTKRHSDIHILVGNSGAESNNHLDAFEELKSIKNIKIFCPLSYGGSERYVNLVIQTGKALFGDKFIPVTNFMSREEYINFYDEIEIVFMYHNRQQAFGNICTALTKGKPVFLKMQNSIKGYLDALNVKTYNVKDISRMDLNEVIKEARQDSSVNKMILEKIISKQTRLSNLKLIMDKTK